MMVFVRFAIRVRFFDIRVLLTFFGAFEKIRRA